MKLIAIVLLLFTLSGCVTQPERDPIIVTKTVEVPIEVKCVIYYPKEPSSSASLPAPEASGYAKVQAALQELEDQRQYAKELRAVLSKCATETN